MSVHSVPQLTHVLAVGAGGFVGAVLRFLVNHVVVTVLQSSALPVGTAIVNLSGSFLLGFLATRLTGGLPVAAEVRLFVLVGVLGSFTTFSTFSFETLELIRANEPLTAGLVAIGEVTLGLLLAFGGFALAQRV